MDYSIIESEREGISSGPLETAYGFFVFSSRRRHTSCGRDWSSDVCSSDLGNRQANAALYRIVIVRLRWHQPTREYMARRIAEGKTKTEAIRCLKRYVAREVFAVLNTLAFDLAS